jgi:hypothetical protein
VQFVYTELTQPRFGPRNVQGLILSAVLMIVGFQVLLIGLLADVISANRKLLEDLVYRVRSLELTEPRSDSEPVAPAGSGARADDRWER